MGLTYTESESLTSVSRRYANMFKRYMPEADDFDSLLAFLIELQQIHKVAIKVINTRFQAVIEADDLAAESHCNLSRFFAARSARAKLARNWRKIYQEIFTPETMAAIKDACAKQGLISEINTGYLGFYTGREKGQMLLDKLASDPNQMRITFTNGDVLELGSLKEEVEADKLREVHARLTANKMIPLR